MDKKFIAIIGGGAGGIMSAIVAAKTLKENKINDTNIVILERMDRAGKKLLATGNGRCNISNINADTKYYHSKNIDFIDKILKKFTPQDTIDFFDDIGIMCNIEADGKVYPYSNQASSVLDVLRMEALQLGIQEICNFEVKSIKKQGNKFVITDKSGKIQEAIKVIIATGGKASPNLGSNGSGYELLKSHTLIDTFPALVQLKSDTQYVKALNGIKVNGTASVVKNNKVIRKEEGEILFTEYGLSGIVILQLSRIISEHFTNKNNKPINIVLDIMPEFNQDKLIDIISKRARKQGFKNLENFFTGMLNKRVGQMILKSSGIVPLSRLSNSLSNDEIITIVKNIKSWEFNITGTMSWSNAQVTAGGINTNEFNSNTLESKLIAGLYAVGEVLDIDGDCGGFNLQWAWSTGFVAGKAVANKN